jgi:hypothetical protein
MPKRSKEAQEEFLVREFLDQQHARVSNLERLSQRIPNHDGLGIAGPDIWATVDWQENSLEVAFEVTDYYLDSDGRGSEAMRRKNTWNEVCRHIQLEHPDRAAFRKLHVAVSFTSCLPKKVSVVALANELAAFLLSHLPAEGYEAHYHRFGNRLPNSGDFDQHPLLYAHLQRVTVRTTDYKANRRLWHCADAAVIGVSAPIIAQIVQDKTTGYQRYNLDGANECWLLICAGGNSATNRAGLQGDPPAAANEEELVTAVKRTPFDKVILWDRIDSEYIELKSMS